MSLHKPISIFTIALLAAWCGGRALAQETTEQTEFFESRIRPVLAQDCYACHNSQEEPDGGLVLDHRAGLLKGGDRGPVIVPGKPNQSLLIQAIRHEVEDLEMPSAAPKLEDSVIRDFENWVRMGAPDPRDHPPADHEQESDTNWPAVLERRKSWWSFRPIQDPKTPSIENVVHPIDRFIVNRLADEGLEPAQPAERQVLLRRLTFALTGLPPTKEQRDRFEQQPDRNTAIESLIDELLDSPHFGERWARHWMDWIRYAESHGSEGDPAIENAWLYRDYLIRALNKDVPYNQLVREHIAGDLLAEPRQNRELGLNESLIGTAHWRMVFHGFAPTDALDEKVRFTDDQINVFSKAFLGLTVSCARCHNHKFDAISQADYYAMFGILGSTRPGRKAVELPAIQATNAVEIAKLKIKIRAALADVWLQNLDALEDNFSSDPNRWMKMKQPSTPLSLLKKMKMEGDNFAEAWKKQVREWEVYRAERAADRREEFAFGADFAGWFREGIGLNHQPSKPGEFAIQPTGELALQGIYPSGVYSHLISQKHPARFTSPDVHLSGKKTLWLYVLGGGSAMARYVVHNYPRNGTVYPFTELKNDQDSNGRWIRYNVDYWDGDDIHVELTTARDAPLLTKPSDRSWFGIREAVLLPTGAKAPLALRDALEPIFAAAEEDPPESFADLVSVYVKALTGCVDAWKSGTTSNGMASFLNACLSDGLLENRLPKIGSAQELIESYRQLDRSIPIPTRVPTLAEWQGRDQPLLHRGNHKQPREPVARRFLEAIDATPYQTQLSGRLELADDLLRKDNPFTRRVIVNRVWHHLFGRGIVPSTDNFGRMGEKPSHPALLDYLAQRFAEDGWSIKNLIRLIVTSKTWQQDSQPSQKAMTFDPENDLLSHFSIRRLDAEALRDSLLSAAGTLDKRLYGPPVSGGSDRRSVYVAIIRNRLDPFLSTFDAPVPFSTTGRRNETTVPAQSLTMFNSPFVLKLANRAVTRIGEREEFIARAWHRLLGREPSLQEHTHAVQLVEALQAKYDALNEKRQDLKTRIAEHTRRIRAIHVEVRSKLLGSEEQQRKEEPVDLHPLAHWDFEHDLRDSVGSLHATVRGSARLDNGALVLDGKSWASTGALNQTLRAKTLQTQIVLDDVDQRGGGVFSIQTLDGAKFDSIVFGELNSKRWLAGSDFHRRTKRFNGSDEVGGSDRSVVLTFVYRADGTITGYRNGQAYGRPYKTSVQVFEKGKSQILFGLRHGTNATGNRLFSGRLLNATLYDRALTPDEVAIAAKGDPHVITQARLVSEMSAEQRQMVVEGNRKIQRMQSELESLGEPVSSNQALADLVLSIFNMKEFIYVR